MPCVILILLQSEDIQLLKDEIELVKDQLQLADHLLAECTAVRRRGRRRGEGGTPRSGTPTGPGKRRLKKTSGERKNKLLCSKK